MYKISMRTDTFLFPNLIDQLTPGKSAELTVKSVKIYQHAVTLQQPKRQVNTNNL
ncbi:hypothetical protein OGY61_11635 [Citrobacter sp. CK196]|uniref:hypothetical protein n=1 Tax=Enterobacteriaceae TaxID=543 RepID=UPI0025776175|nr:hypothetical protein [Citrobacter sp. CK196]MDM2986504.1 hypothetical protein [Citrobacter sp. CK196]